MADDKSNMDLVSADYTAGKQQQYEKILNKLKEEFDRAHRQKKTYTVCSQDFIKIRLLGTGAFGVVYLAKYTKSGQYFAMKLLEKEKVVKQKQIAHSLSEKNILCSIKFPFTIYMEFFFKDYVYLYYVLPFVPGGEMFTHLRKVGRYDEEMSKFYSSQIVLAMEYLHHCQLIYRDLKPENILIERTGYLKVTDFGFCKLMTGRTWSLCGTPEYLAPETILCKGYGFTVDWWSTGVLIYEMCAGYAPFVSSDPMKIYEKIVAGKYKCPSHFSHDLKCLLSNMMQVNITKRFGNLKDGVLDIKRAKWYRSLDWDAVFEQSVKPPYIPVVSFAGDTSNFDSYEDESELIKECSINMYEADFKDF